MRGISRPPRINKGTIVIQFTAGAADQPKISGIVVTTSKQINAASAGAVDMLDFIKKAKGTRLAAGRNTKPTGPLRVKTYYVEDIQLPKPISITKDGKPTSVTTVYRLTIRGQQFPVRALIPVIWIDGTAYSDTQQSDDLTSLSILLFGRSELKDGATIAVGYGEEQKDMLTTLPEKLQLGKRH